MYIPTVTLNFGCLILPMNSKCLSQYKVKNCNIVSKNFTLSTLKRSIQEFQILW